MGRHQLRGGRKPCVFLDRDGVLNEPLIRDGRPHPPDPDVSFNGDSRAHWEGDTLVVDTVGFNEKFWMSRDGLPHTDRLHLIERFSRPDARTLRYEVTIDDPGAYTRPWSSTWTMRWVAGQEMPVYFCQENRP